MYNKLQKQRYIASLTESSKNKIQAVFKRTAAYEEKLDLDCSNFTVQDILACFKQCNTSSINTLRNMKSALSVYTDWCREQNLLRDGINHYTEIGQPNLLACLCSTKVEKSYLSEDEVIFLVTQMENAFEKVAILLAYEGFLFANYDAAYMVSSDDIDGSFLKVGEQEHKASPYLLEYIEEAEAADCYYLRQMGGNVKEMPFKPGGGPVFKQLYNAVREYNTMELRRFYFERLFRRIREYTGESFITIKKLNDSGRINELKRIMDAENAIDARKCFMKHKAELDAKYGIILEVGRFFAVHGDAFAVG